MINGMRTQQLSPKRVKMPREHGDLYIGQDEVAQGHLSCGSPPPEKIIPSVETLINSELFIAPKRYISQVNKFGIFGTGKCRRPADFSHDHLGHFLRLSGKKSPFSSSAF